MKKILKRGLSLVLTLIMVAGMLPLTAFAAVDSSGRPTDLKNKLVLSIYTTEGTFPGEPATHGSSEYISFKSDFTTTSASGQFKSSAEDELDPSILGENVLVQGTGNSSTKVWGVFSAEGLDQYFLKNASIIQPENEKKIIQEVKNCSAEDADQYEIIWYVIKLQHSPSSWWWSNGTTEWHIDGLIKEKRYVSINYYGNGNTSGAAPDGITNHTAGEPYTILGKNTMVKKINGVAVDFLGWSAQPDGSGTFYKPGTVIKPKENISLYAMWDTTTQYTATVKTYLDGNLADESDIHNETDRDLYLSTDKEHYYQLTKKSEGVYTARITGNGKFHLYQKDAAGNYIQIGDRQLTIYNQDGSMDVNHYSVTYDANGGEFAAAPGTQIYYYGDTVTAIAEQPTKEGYRFLGWNTEDDGAGTMIQSGGDVTESITAPITLYAQWEKTVTVTVNVTINHKVANDPNGDLGYDKVAGRTKVDLALVSRANDDSPYLETGNTLKLSNADQDKPDEITVTKYEDIVFENMPGGTVDYTVVTSKSGYETTITPEQDKNGNWTINVVMTYRPTNFDVNFTVVTDPKLLEIENTTGGDYVPDAAIVKVTFWSNEAKEWQIITQQDKDQQGKELPGVRVDLNEKGEGSGSYPVWMYESDGTTPYGYRVEVTSFVYPDGTIVRASDVVTQDVAWTDQVYTATVSDVTDGRDYGLEGSKLGGAYYDDVSKLQKGTLNVTITMDLYNVTFNAQGGKVNGQDIQQVENQYKIPSFKDYVPTRDGGYTFAGWYVDKDCTTPAKEGADLNADNTSDGNITLYAKWLEPLTIKGDLKIMGTYKLNGQDVEVNDIDKAKEAVVVLQEIRNENSYYEVATQDITFKYNADKNGSASYEFTQIPNDGKKYRIQVLELNYTTEYNNNGDEEFSGDEYTVVFGGNNVAEVDAMLTFVPPSYSQELIVKTDNISKEYLPEDVLAKILYRDTGDNYPYQVISQHRDSEDLGVNIALTNGEGSGTESIWKWHTDGTLYEYQMYITKVDGTAYDSDTAPFDIVYGDPAYWHNDTNPHSVALEATLTAKTYPVIFDLNAGEDTVTGMDAFKIQETGLEEDIYAYRNGHTWSHETEFSIENAVPQREGYVFQGWETTVPDVTVGDSEVNILADVHEEVVLKAKWEKISYSVKTTAEPNEGGTVSGAGTFAHGTQVTVVATPSEGYNFLGWYENGEQVSTDLSYSFEIRDNHDFTAKFSLNKHTVNTVADPSEGGTTSGDDVYDYGASATVSATAKPGYTFAGWYENGELVSSDAEYTFTVSTNHKLTAHFSENTSYTITANTTDGGTATGGGSYKEGTTATLTAEPKATHKFLGWFENGELVCADEVYSFVVTENRTLKASFGRAVTVTTVASPEGVGELTGGGMYASGATVTLAATANNGYCFVGWYDEAGNLLDGDTLTVWEDITLTAKFVEKKTYRSDSVYLFGYEDTQIGAEGPLLRGELAQMIYRLVRENGTPRTNGKVFADTQGQWFQSGMSYMAQVGAIDSMQENANPYAAVSRGETYKMICLGLRLTDDTTLRFSQYATILRNHSYLVPEGTPTGNIARWQFCALFNDILGRSGHPLIDLQGNKVTHETYQYTDLDPNASYYNTMLIATSSFKEGKVDVEGRIDRNKYDYTDPN